MSRLSRKSTATAVVLAALLGLTILSPPAAAQPHSQAPGASLWQQAWAFLFGGRLTSLWAEDGSCMDPDGKPAGCAQSSGLTTLRGEEGSTIDPNGQHSTNPPSGELTTLRNAGRVSNHRL